MDIEIQCHNTHDIPERAIQYLARMLNENADKSGKNEESRDYHYPKVIGIWILGQNVTDRASAISESSMVFHKNDRDDSLIDSINERHKNIARRFFCCYINCVMRFSVVSRFVN